MRHAMLIGLISIALSTPAAAQTIRLVVPFPAGGSADILTRTLGSEVARVSGWNVIVDDRPGASSIIGTEIVSRASPDGSTLLMPSNSFLLNSFLRTLSYDPLTSFRPICHLVDSPQVLVVKADVQITTLSELVTAARAKPHTITIGANGPATTQHVNFAMLEKSSGAEMVFVPYPAGPPAVNALLGGQVSAIISNYSEVSSHIESGALRALAVSSKRRLERLPQVPTLREAGVDFDLPAWFGVVAPAKTPDVVISKMSDLFRGAVRSQVMREMLKSQQLELVDSCGASFSKFLSDQAGLLSRVVRESGMKLE